MLLSKLELKDIRAEIEVGEDKVIIKNPKGEVKEYLYVYFKQQVELKGQSGSATEGEIFRTLIEELTNIEIDSDGIDVILNNPSHEMNMIRMYLYTIMQEIVFEIVSAINLEMKVQQNILLEKDTLATISNLQQTVEEVNDMAIARREEDGKEIQ